MLRLSIYSLYTLTKNTFCKYLGYTVTAYWEDSVFVHYCYNWDEAIDWCKQYRAECTVVISQYLSTQCIVRF